MVHRKGELGRAMMDPEWPHRLVLPTYRCMGHSYLTMRFFCEGEGLSLCPRTQSFRRDGHDMVVFSFAKRAHAEQFRDRFGGEFLDPENSRSRPSERSHYASRQSLRA
jgi:hypothetical protein